MTSPSFLRQLDADALHVEIYADRPAMGEAAARYVAGRLGQMLAEQEGVRMVVGSAPSQDDFFDALVRQRVDWSRVEVFHMDEYIGLAADHPQTFRRYQYDHLLAHVEPKAFHAIQGEAEDIEAECQRISGLLAEHPVDLVCLGIGENGHLAFNDPPADFDELAWVKVVTLDSVCRQQQVNDGCFPTVEDVPTQAITLSLRVFQTARVLSGVVPALSKAGAVRATVEGPITESCPATLMRTHPDARLFLDPDSASLLEPASS
ncbi:MAG: glucosamine-6-phosphate deaminase [Rubricoccaceae bacterium]